MQLCQLLMQYKGPVFAFTVKFLLEKKPALTRVQRPTPAMF